MKRSVIIVAGGSGTRMNAALPKQFLLLAGKPILMHVIERFHAALPGIGMILVLPAGHLQTWNRLCAEYGCGLPHRVVVGGETRFQSVKNALEHLDDQGYVAVHDGARPLVTTTLIRRSFDEAEKHGSSIPVVQIQESIRRIDQLTNTPVDRSCYFRVQTPQVFQCRMIRQAYMQEFRSEFTDDASVIESLGGRIHTFPGEESNIKITAHHDLDFAEILLQSTILGK